MVTYPTHVIPSDHWSMRMLEAPASWVMGGSGRMTSTQRAEHRGVVGAHEELT